MLKRTILTFLAVGLLTLGSLAISATAEAQGGWTGGMSGGANSAKGADQPTDIFSDGGVFSQFTNILLYLIGAVSVIMIIFGGFRYITSGGKSENITAAKNTIMYAVIGIIIALLSYAIVNFVITALSTASTGGGGGGATSF